jgi:hypothetical protein
MAEKHFVKRFESFNAKYLPPEMVAETFIPPPQWKSLTANNHSLLVGPRGAGKTTLLKMLTAPGISAWKHPTADEFRKNIAFIGVFVTTDRTWSEQLSALGSGLGEIEQTAFGVATFTAHALHALAEAAADRVHRPGLHSAPNLDPVAEADIASECADRWGLTSRPIVTLRALQLALTDRIAELADLAERAGVGGAESSPGFVESLPTLSFDSSALQLIERFNLAVGEPDRLWCFLFDELELAPSAVLRQLIRGLRGGDRRLLFKLSLAPYTDGAVQLRTALSAQQAHDYAVEQLTYPHKHEPLDFCRALLAKRLNIDPTELDAQEILGRSVFSADRSELGDSQTAYQPESKQISRMKKLAEIDRTFATWLDERDVDLDEIAEMDPNRRASTVRKVATIATLRLAYRTTDQSYASSGRHRRTRKSYSTFAGVPALFDMVEGNPRWFMNLIAPLAEQPTPKDRQGAHIREVVRLFRAILSAMPLPPAEARIHKLGALPVLDAIGKRLSELIIDEDFNSDPPGKFRVDARVPDEVVVDLEFALNAGGIIHMPGPEDDDVLEDLRGQTFRLAHLLAPWYPIPLTTGGRAIDLTNLLAGREPSWDLSRQMEFEDEHLPEEDPED